MIDYSSGAVTAAPARVGGAVSRSNPLEYFSETWGGRAECTQARGWSAAPARRFKVFAVGRVGCDL